MGLFSKKREKSEARLIRAMLVMVVHPDTTLLEPPGNVREFCTNVAGDVLPGVPMATDAKTGVVTTPYSGSLDEAIARVRRDIPGVMDQFAAQQGIDLGGYETTVLDDDFTPEIRLVAMAALG
ncbi:MAG TPA: hypothetical protein DCP20_09040 [Coriobacteriia bacterium]|nr:MAG: hypothetical protein XD74_0390 [Actinobacteria bacterium 66_15]HAL30842.1 hypothetical protein [Coriobacteriia bacterium]